MAKPTLSAKISNCTISLGLDKRHSKSNLYPVCIRYSFNGKFMYFECKYQKEMGGSF